MNENHHFRHSPRPQIAVKVEVICKDSKIKFESYTKDVGTGGLFLADDNGLKDGQKVQVFIDTPSTWNPLSLLAKVVWVRSHIGVGLQFVNLSDTQRLSLNNFISTLDYNV